MNSPILGSKKGQLCQKLGWHKTPRPSDDDGIGSTAVRNGTIARR